MTNTLLYPSREHLEPIRNFCDVLEFEIGIHTDAPELRKGLSTISKMYRKFPLSRSMQQYSRLMAISHAQAGHIQYENGLDIDFHRGSVLATHCTLRAEKSRTRKILLNNDEFSKYLTVEQRHEIPLQDLESIVDGLRAWRYGGFMDSLSQETDEFQELVINAAIRAYDDVSNTPENEDSFISGFMMARDLLGQKLIDLDYTPYQAKYSSWDPRV